MTDMPLCVDCKHFEEHRGFDAQGGRTVTSMCLAFSGKRHPVLGGVITAIVADQFRMAICGWDDPKFFVEKK